MGALVEGQLLCAHGLARWWLLTANLIGSAVCRHLLAKPKGSLKLLFIAM